MRVDSHDGVSIDVLSSMFNLSTSVTIMQVAMFIKVSYYDNNHQVRVNTCMIRVNPTCPNTLNFVLRKNPAARQRGVFKYVLFIYYQVVRTESTPCTFQKSLRLVLVKVLL